MESDYIHQSLFIILLEELLISGVTDPDIELWLAYESNDAAKIDNAIKAGANIKITSTDIYNKYSPQIEKILSLSPRIKLFFILHVLSEKTWKRLEWSKSLNLSQGEETITDINLLEIKSHQIEGIDVWKCPKDLESQAGIDWLWLIGSNMRGWRMFAVQAKKLDVKTEKYKKLNYEVTNIGRLQIDILKEFAANIGAVPVYCLYNYVTNVNSSHWHCSYSYDEKQLGCSITNITVIETAIKKRGKKTFDSVHSDMCTIPWRCLIECRLPSFTSKTKPYEYTDECFGMTIVYPRIPHKIGQLLLTENYNEVLDIIGSDLVPKKILVCNLDSAPNNENIEGENFQQNRG